MSSTIHSSAYVITKHEETSNYCSGSGTTKNAPEKFEAGDLAQLASMDKIVSINPPLAQYEQKIYYGAMDGEYGTTVKENFKPGTGSIVQWLQTKANADRVITNSTFGSIPASEDWHMEDKDTSPNEKIEMYGIISKSLAFTLDGIGGKVLQTREVWSPQLKHAANVDDLDLSTKGQATSAPVLANSVTITVDSVTHTNLSIPGFTHSIETEIYEEHVIGSPYVLEPSIINRTHTIGFNSNKKASNTWFADLVDNTTVQTFSIVITYGSVVKFTYTNMSPMRVVEHNIPGRGRIVNDYGFMPTASTTCTVATP
jgi:hypothetical protein